MSDATEMRRGWCPSVAHPMPTGDGLLVRLSMPGGNVPLALIRGIASCARRFGNGLVDLTRRGNLQLRGVSEATFPALLEELSLFAIPGTTEATEVPPDVLLSPLAGIDPKAVCNILPVAAELRAHVAADRGLRLLPAKFCFIIDDGGRLGLDDIDADIRFKARHSNSGSFFAVALGGPEEKAVTLGACSATDVANVAARLAHAFLDLRGRGEAPRRMARLVESRGAPAILRSAGLERDFLPLADLPPLGPPPEQLGKPPVGFDLTCENSVLGFGVALGRLTADQLAAIADALEEDRGELRLTPWRVVLVALRGREWGKINLRFEQMGLITAANDARLRIAACPGIPHCSRATVSTHEDALALGRVAQGLILSGIGLHVSGCAKGCARSLATKATLVGRDGRYDLVIDGAAGDAPMREALTLKEAKMTLEQIVEEIWAERMRLDPEWEKHV